MCAIRSISICLCSLAVSLAMFVAQAAAEPVQISPTVDANTTALWLFKEGTGTTVPNEVTGGQPINVALGTWVPGRQNYAVATDSASEPNHGFVNVLDDASNHPQAAITIEAWVKINYTSGYMVSKNTELLIESRGWGLRGAVLR